jgi:hypothetical protein
VSAGGNDEAAPGFASPFMTVAGVTQLLRTTPPSARERELFAPTNARNSPWPQHSAYCRLALDCAFQP